MCLSTFENDGFCTVPSVLSQESIDALIHAIELYSKSVGNVSRREGTIYGLRDLLREIPAIRELAQSTVIRETIVPLLGDTAFAVRALYFDKTPEANWPVPWHQDCTIAVAERKDVTGFNAWSEKNGVIHVQPPTEVLEGMVALRLHLDSCPLDNGPLRVLPGTHRLGKLSPEAIRQQRDLVPEVTCVLERGDGLLIRPLLLHSSRVVTGCAPHRRVVHLEFASKPLPGGLQWYDSL